MYHLGSFTMYRIILLWSKWGYSGLPGGEWGGPLFNTIFKNSQIRFIYYKEFTIGTIMKIFKVWEKEPDSTHLEHLLLGNSTDVNSTKIMFESLLHAINCIWGITDILMNSKILNGKKPQNA